MIRKSHLLKMAVQKIVFELLYYEVRLFIILANYFFTQG